jgi:hypothetical protein
MANLFWTDRNLEPKRAYRFLVNIIGMGPGAATFFATKVNKPQIDITETEHKYLNHTFYYPGRVQWNTVTVTLVDPVNPDASQNLAAICEASGYVIPRGPGDVTTMSKAAAVNNLGDVVIEQYDDAGDLQQGPTLPIETWRLKNAFIKNINFGELDYESDELNKIEVEFRYDWAELTTRTVNTANPSDQGLARLDRDNPTQRWKLE